MKIVSTNHLDFDQKAVLLNLEDQVECLLNAQGKRVRVNIQLEARESAEDNPTKAEFPPNVAVHGDLEVLTYEDGGGHDRVMFRVLTGESSDSGSSYAYFNPEDIYAVMDRRTTDKGVFDGGAFLAIYLQGTPTHPATDRVVYVNTNDSSTVGGGKT